MGSSYGLELGRDENWRLSAACRGYDPEWWSLSAGKRGQGYDEAHRICDTCPVAVECEELAENTGSWGMIFGGRDFVKPVSRSYSIRTWQHCTRRACGVVFEAANARQTYCCDKCRSIDHAARRPSRPDRPYESRQRDRKGLRPRGSSTTTVETRRPEVDSVPDAKEVA